MSTPSYSELIATIRKEGEQVLAAARFGLDAAVPACVGWSVDELLLHLGRVYCRAATLVSERSTSQQDYPPAPEAGADPIDYLTDALDDLVEALASADPDTPVWNWSDEPQTAAFWARRMAHESAVHRYDAQRAHGVAQPIDDDLARDGLDEMIDILLPRIVSRDQVSLPSATYLLTAADDGAWAVRLGPDGVERFDVAKEPDVVVRGTASALLLAGYNRVKWSSLEVEGNASLLDDWSRLLKF
ncbi:MAG TPA: maleylpyruvate isomerase family mycothiol-dependent enzyme [Mycobacteriales bacterium]|nr:maleylpyruvate isomerase family mycothiol-dependent enzyme [Mycobacteriales bacterium]